MRILAHYRVYLQVVRMKISIKFIVLASFGVICGCQNSERNEPKHADSSIAQGNKSNKTEYSNSISPIAVGVQNPTILENNLSLLFTTDTKATESHELNDSTVADYIFNKIKNFNWSGNNRIEKPIHLQSKNSRERKAFYDRMQFEMYGTSGVFGELNWEAESGHETDGGSLIFQSYFTKSKDSSTFAKVKNKVVSDYGKPSDEKRNAFFWNTPTYRIILLQDSDIIIWSWMNGEKAFCNVRGNNVNLMKALYSYSLAGFRHPIIQNKQ
jgi:hypothetical protein